MRRLYYIFLLLSLSAIMFAGRVFFVYPPDSKELQGSVLGVTVRGMGVDSLKLEVGEDRKPVLGLLRADNLYDFIGVELPSGDVPLILYGKSTKSGWKKQDSIMVFVPGELADFTFKVTPEKYVADGKSRGKLQIIQMDKWDRIVKAPMMLTISATGASIVDPDNDDATSGFQVFSKDGISEINFKVGENSGEMTFTVTANNLRKTLSIPLSSNLRPMIFVGHIGAELGYNYTSEDIPDSDILSDIPEEGIHGDARGAFFMQGGIYNKYLLTMSYDSKVANLPTASRRKAPDELMPIYGDTGSIFYLHRASSPLYLRLEKDKSFVEWSDFDTQLDINSELTIYRRTLTGLNSEYYGEHIDVKAFVSPILKGVNYYNRTSVIDSIQPDGTSGFYELSNSNIIRGTEKVRIVWFDRYQPDVIIGQEEKQRFTDYEINYEEAEILFNEAIHSYDDYRNPAYIYVEYEVPGEYRDAYTSGARLEYHQGDFLRAGITYIREDMDTVPLNMAGADITFDHFGKYKLRAEVGYTDNEQRDDTISTHGLGYAISGEMNLENIQAKAYFKKVDEGYQNKSAISLMPGHTKVGGELDYKYKTFSAGIEGFSEQFESDITRNRVLIELSKKIDDFTAIGGFEYWNTQLDDSSTTDMVGMAKLVWKPTNRYSMHIRRQQSVNGNDEYPTETALGADLRLTNKYSLFGSLGLIEIDEDMDQFGTIGLKSTALGVNTTGELRYTKGDAFNSEAIIGISDRIEITPKIFLDFSFENESAIYGDDSDDHIAGSLGWTFKPDGWLLTQKTEYLTHKTNGDKASVLAGASTNMGQSLSLLMKEHIEFTNSPTENFNEFHISRNQAMLGLALRPNYSDYLNMIVKAEHKLRYRNFSESWQFDSIAVDPFVYDNRLVFSIANVFSLYNNLDFTVRYAGKIQWTTLGIENPDSTVENLVESSTYTDLILGKLTADITNRFDVGIEGRVYMQHTTNDIEFDYAPEIGIVIYRNIRLGIGYNVSGYDDTDLSDGNWWAKGPYITIDLKLSENGLNIPDPYMLEKQNDNEINSSSGSEYFPENMGNDMESTQEINILPPAGND